VTAARVVVVLGAVALSSVLGCSYHSPMSHSEDSVVLTITPEEMIIQGSTTGSTRRFRLLFFGFGPPNSFLRAESKAIEAGGSELLVNRMRLRHFTGFLIPGLWLQALGAAEAADLPVLGWEIYTVAGTGVRLVPKKENP